MGKVRKKIRQIFRQDDAEHHSDLKKREHFYYECIYDVLRSQCPHGDKLLALNRFKAKIVKLYSERLKSVMIDNSEDRLEGEEPPLYHTTDAEAPHSKNHLECTRLPWLLPKDFDRHRTRSFATFLRHKYEPIAVDNSCVEAMVEAAQQARPTTYEEIQRLITPDDVSDALRKRGRNKAPGSDGIGLEFYSTNWAIIKDDISEIVNQMFMQRTITTQQKHGVIVCVPKTSGAQTPAGYRSITLLNTDYKLLARIIAHRLRPVMEEHLKTIQFCG